MTRARRVDSNQGEIVSVLRQIGCSVFVLSSVGKGCTDLLIGYRRKNILLEIKDSSKPPSKRKLTPDQVIFRAEWRGQYDVATSISEAISVVTRETVR